MLYRFLALLLSLCWFNLAYATTVSKSELAVTNIEVGAMEQDSSPNHFTLLINFRNNGAGIAKWRLGFYMPRSFFSLAASQLNPELELQICDSSANCSNLGYLKASSAKEADLSQGYFTVLEPLEMFPLLGQHNYFLRLAHNNQWPAANISALPQSLFIINLADNDQVAPKIALITTEISDYQIKGYDQNTKDDEIRQHLSSNWQNSQALVPQKQPKIVPAPVSLVEGGASDYLIPKKVTLHNQLNEDNSLANWWGAIIKQDWKLKKDIQVDNDQMASDGIIITSISAPKAINNSPEGYRLTIASNSINIETLTASGAYYAMQTLRQLWQQYPDRLPAITITDYPRFKYRGILLDSARHYFSLAEIKSLIDVMAAQKLNTLHIHFSDDEAFRLSLPSVPAIQPLAASRGLGQAIGPNMLLQNNLDTTNLSQLDYPVANSTYAGSYTPSDIKELLSYANSQQITLIPEIDLPGHARALIKALPEVMLDPNDSSQFVSVQGYTDDVLPVCTYASNISLGKQFTPLINNIIQDVAALFNQQTTQYAQSNEVSLGGDEVSPQAWSNDSSCRGEWLGLSALNKSHLFFQKVAAANPSLLLSGYQQLVQSEGISLGKSRIASNQVGHIWVWNTSAAGIKQAAALSNQNYPTVLAYADKGYFDLAYTPSMYEPGFTWAGSFADSHAALSLADAATKTMAAAKNPQNILGLEGSLWSENIPSYDHLMYMALPKMPALAEAAWSPLQLTVNSQHQLNWQSLAERLGCGKDGFLNYLHQLYRVNYRGYPHGISKEIPAASLCTEAN